MRDNVHEKDEEGLDSSTEQSPEKVIRASVYFLSDSNKKKLLMTQPKKYVHLNFIVNFHYLDSLFTHRHKWLRISCHFPRISGESLCRWNYLASKSLLVSDQALLLSANLSV